MRCLRHCKCSLFTLSRDMVFCLMLYFCKDCSNRSKTCVLLIWKNNAAKQFSAILLLGSMVLHCFKTELLEETADMGNGYWKPGLGSLVCLGDDLSYSIQG